MARYPGTHAAVYIAADGTGAAAALGGMATWTLDMSAPEIDCTACNDANQRFVQGLEKIGGTISGFWDDTDDALYDATQSTDGTKLYLYPSIDVPTKYWYGPAWINMSVDTGVSDAAKWSATFSANGNWGQY